MLWAIIVVLLILWLLGGGVHFGGSGFALFRLGELDYLIHIVLVIALVLLVVQLVMGRREPMP